MGALKDILQNKSFAKFTHIIEKTPLECQSSSLYSFLLKLDMNTGARQSGNSLEISEAKFREYYFESKEQEFDNTDWRNIPWCMYSGEVSLLSNEKLFEDYRKRLLANKKRTEINSLITSYFANFNENSSDTKTSSGLILELITQDPKLEPWAKKHKNLSLFSPDHVLDKIAKKLYEDKDSLNNILLQADLIISANDNYSQFLGAIHKKFCELVAYRGKLNKEKTLELMQWSCLEGQIRYPQNKAELLDALLIPWLDKTPEEKLKIQIFDFVLKYYKDPRISQVNWVGCSGDAKKIFLGWLTAKSLEQFFSVVDRVAQQLQKKILGSLQGI